MILFFFAEVRQENQTKIIATGESWPVFALVVRPATWYHTGNRDFGPPFGGESNGNEFHFSPTWRDNVCSETHYQMMMVAWINLEKRVKTKTQVVDADGGLDFGLWFFLAAKKLPGKKQTNLPFLPSFPSSEHKKVTIPFNKPHSKPWPSPAVKSTKFHGAKC